MIEKTFSVDGPVDLEISVPAGTVTIEPGVGGSVRVEVDTVSPDEWQVGQSRNAIWVRHDRLIGRGGRARVRIAAPDGTSLTGRTASANLRLALSLDRVSLATASGDVEMGDATDVSAKTASGDVRIGTVAGDLDVRSASGDIAVGRVAGRLDVTTASGDVVVDDAQGDVSASSASGDVRIRRFVGGDVDASTMSGNLRFGLPPGRTVKLDAKTLSGSVRLPDRRPATGSGGPAVHLRLKSVSGNIVIDRLD